MVWSSILSSIVFINFLLDFHNSTCRWIDNQENLLFFGPPGVGKTHLGIAFGVAAIEKGYKVCFERISNLIKLLKTAEIQKKSEYRIRRLMKSALLIIDKC